MKIDKEFIEICWLGRGGQGAKTVAFLLAHACLDDGKFIQAFPEYGPERAGAPVRAYTRIAQRRISRHCAVRHPDITVVIDSTLLGLVSTFYQLDKESIIIINTELSSRDLEEVAPSAHIFTLGATRIALETLGRAMPNIPMLGGLIKVLPIVSLDRLKSVIETRFLKKMGRESTYANIQGIERAYREIREAK